MVVSQNVTPSKRHLGGAFPMAFTETGVAMLSSALRNLEKCANMLVCKLKIHFGTLSHLKETHLLQLANRYFRTFAHFIAAIPSMHLPHLLHLHTFTLAYQHTFTFERNPFVPISTTCPDAGRIGILVHGHISQFELAHRYIRTFTHFPSTIAPNTSPAQLPALSNIFFQIYPLHSVLTSNHHQNRRRACVLLR